MMSGSSFHGKTGGHDNMEIVLVYISIGFLSAIGWYGANKALLEPFVDPYVEQIKAEKKAKLPTVVEPVREINEDKNK